MSIQLAYIQNINIAFFNFFYRIPPPQKKYKYYVAADVGYKTGEGGNSS